MIIQYLCIMCLCLSSSLYANWHDRKAEGWAWYEDIKKQKEKKPAKEKIQPKSSKDLLEGEKKELEEVLSHALLEPTPENIKKYIMIQTKWHNQASHFAKEWQKVILSNPILDQTTNYPTSQYGLQFYKEELSGKKERLINQLSQKYGLIFFYEGEKQESKIFSNVVKMLVRKHKWEVMAISVDGKTIDGFKNNKNNNGLVQALDIQIYPSLYVLTPDTNDLLPVSFGLRSLDVIENNIYLQFSNLDKGEV